MYIAVGGGIAKSNHSKRNDSKRNDSKRNRIESMQGSQVKGNVGVGKQVASKGKQEKLGKQLKQENKAVLGGVLPTSWKTWKRKSRRKKIKNRRKNRGTRKERWCRVQSESTNTKVVRTWNKSRHLKRDLRRKRALEKLAKLRSEIQQQGKKKGKGAAIVSGTKQAKKTSREKGAGTIAEGNVGKMQPTARGGARQAKKKSNAKAEKSVANAQPMARGNVAQTAKSQTKDVTSIGSGTSKNEKALKLRQKKKAAKNKARKWTGVVRKSVVKSAGSRGYKNVRHRGTDYAARKVLRKVRQSWKGVEQKQSQILGLPTKAMNGKGRVNKKVDSSTLRRSKQRRRVGAMGVGFHVRREGAGKGSKARMKVFAEQKRKCRSVSDRTREEHNGCKGKKARRR